MSYAVGQELFMLKKELVSGLVVALALMASSVAAQSASDAQQPVFSNEGFDRMSASVVEGVLHTARQRPSDALIGLHEMNGDSRRLSIVSMRVAIAGLAAEAIERGERYVPTESVLGGDAVFIECGDPSLLGGFDCTGLHVTTPAGQRVEPIGYEAGAEAIENEQGTKWMALKAAGTFRVSDLQHGFTVTYVDIDDHAFVYAVSADAAAHDLLLALGESRPARELARSVESSGPQVPQLRLALELVPDGWILSNRSLSRWTTCVASVGESMVKLPVLGVGGVVSLKHEQFLPALDFDAPNRNFTLSVSCQVGDLTLVTTGDGLVWF